MYLFKHTKMVLLATALALLSLGVAADEATTADPRGDTSRAPAPRDVWYAYEDDGQRYGFEHITGEKREDGNVSYRVESKVMLDLLGKRQEISRNATYIVTPAFDLVSLRQESQQQSGATRATGSVQGDEFVLVHERGDLRRERRLKLADKPLPLACLDDWLRAQSGETKALRRWILDDSSLELEDGNFTRKGPADAGDQWEVDLGPAAGHGTIWLDADGVRRQATFHAPNISDGGGRLVAFAGGLRNTDCRRSSTRGIIRW